MGAPHSTEASGGPIGRSEGLRTVLSVAYAIKAYRYCVSLPPPGAGWPGSHASSDPTCRNRGRFPPPLFGSAAGRRHQGRAGTCARAANATINLPGAMSEAEYRRLIEVTPTPRSLLDVSTD